MAVEAPKMTTKREHRPHHIFMVVINFFIHLTLFVLVCMIVTDYDEGVFQKSESTLRNEYQFKVLPPTKTGLEVFVYACQLPWLLYNLVLLIRESHTGYLYYSPEFIPLVLNLSFAGAGILNIAWLFLWSSQKLVAEVCVLSATVGFIFFSFVVTHRKLNEHGLELLQQNLKLDVFLTRLLVHNGIQMYGTYMWLTLCAHCGLVLLEEGVIMNPIDAATLSLGLMAVVIIGDAIFVIFAFDKYTRYSFGTHVVQIWMFATIVAYNFDGSDRNSVIAAVLLVTAIMLFFIKLYRVIKASCTNPEPLLDGVEDDIDNQDIDGEIHLPPLEPRHTPNIEVVHFIRTDMPRTVRAQHGQPPPKTYGPRTRHEQPPPRTYGPRTRHRQPPPRTYGPRTQHRQPPPRTYGPFHSQFRPSYGRAHYTIRGAPMPNMSMNTDDLYHTVIDTGRPQSYIIDPERVRKY